ncbi:hypothetical protein HN51_021415 [Arachis hypogaea]
MVCLEKGTKDRKILDLIKSTLKEHPLKCVSRNDEEKEELRKVKKRRAIKKRILNENEPKSDPYWLRTFFGFAPKEAAKVYGYCGILSPLIANVCLNKLDLMMKGMIIEFFRPSSEKEKTRQMDYIRYKGHFLIGIRGPREDAMEVGKKIIEFCVLTFGLSSGGNIVSEKGVGTLLLVTASMPQCIRQFRHLELVKGDKDSKPLPCTSML